MAYIDLELLRKWRNGETITANEYMQDREFVVVGINDVTAEMNLTKEEWVAYKADMTLAFNNAMSELSVLESEVEQANTNTIQAISNAEMATQLANTAATEAVSQVGYVNTQAEYAKTQGDRAKSVVDGVVKLANHRYSITATQGQVVFTIPLTTFDATMDFIQVMQNTTVLDPSRYTLNGRDITLTEGVEAGTLIYMVILKNTPVGVESSIGGANIAVNSIPQDRIIGGEAIQNNATQIGILSGLNTTAKNNLVAAVNELFQFANDGKAKWSNVVGSPLASSDTFTQMQTKTQTIKNTLATNLTNKGQSSTGTETLTALVNKVASIDMGKKFAKGNATAVYESATNKTYLTVTGLSFTPSIVLVKYNGTNIWLSKQTGHAVFVPTTAFGTVKPVTAIDTFVNANAMEANFYSYPGITSISTNQFKIAVWDGSIAGYGVSWIAIE